MRLQWIMQTTSARSHSANSNDIPRRWWWRSIFAVGGYAFWRWERMKQYCEIAIKGNANTITDALFQFNDVIFDSKMHAIESDAFALWFNVKLIRRRQNKNMLGRRTRNISKDLSVFATVLVRRLFGLHRSGYTKILRMNERFKFTMHLKWNHPRQKP